MSNHFRSGHIAIVGKPNVGKSTLFNALVGRHLSIVTEKPQTTRNNILGIITNANSQMLFLDTPGLLDPRYRLQEIMRGQILEALQHSDVILGIIDGTNFNSTFNREVQTIFSTSQSPLIVVLNKTDLISKKQARNQLEFIKKTITVQKVLLISAKTGGKLHHLQSIIQETLPLGPQYYPEDMLTEKPERFFVSELIREEIFSQLRQEVPYAIAVTVEEFREELPKTYILVNIVVERESQKGIVIGSKGKTLKIIGKNARKKIETFLEHPIFLDLHVKVVENWRKKDTALRSLGFPR